MVSGCVGAALEVLVLSDQEELEKVSQELKGDVFERERGSVEEFEKVQRLVLVEGNQGHRVRMAERRVASVDDVLELCVGDFMVVNVESHDIVCQFWEREFLPSQVFVGPDVGHLVWVEETSIGSETFEDHVFETEELT